MNPIVTEFIKLAAKLIAAEVANHLGEVRKPGEAAKELAVAPAAGSLTTADLFKPECSADRSPEEWRADCLAIINDIAPTHGVELRKLFSAFDAKRLPDIGAEKLPAFLAELVSLRDAN